MIFRTLLAGLGGQLSTDTFECSGQGRKHLSCPSIPKTYAQEKLTKCNPLVLLQESFDHLNFPFPVIAPLKCSPRPIKTPYSVSYASFQFSHLLLISCAYVLQRWSFVKLLSPVIYLPLEDSHCFIELCPVYCFDLCCACLRPRMQQGLQILPRCSKHHRTQVQRSFPGRLCSPWAEHLAQVLFFF